MFKIILFIVFFPIAFPIWLIGKIFDFDKNPAENDDICGDEEDGGDDEDDGDLEEDDYYYEDS